MSNWTLLDLRQDLRTLYNDANATGAQEWPSVDFVVSVLEAYRDLPNQPHALTIRQEHPPVKDRHSESRSGIVLLSCL